MPSAKIEKVLKQYCALMEEIKMRTYSIGEIQACRLPNGVIYETIHLQLRLIYETIALACLVAHDELSIQKRARFMDAYQADWIIKAMEKLHPSFFPIPGEQVLGEDGKPKEVVEIKSGFLTKAELISLYSKSGRVLHRGKFKDIEREKTFDLKELKAITARIIRLLNHHQIQLFDSDYQIWVLMQSKTDGRAQATLFQKLTKQRIGK